jgi:hypothetical protein
MPGFELIGKEEQLAINEFFEKSGGVLFAHGFGARRNGIFHVRNFTSNSDNCMQEAMLLLVPPEHLLKT